MSSLEACGVFGAFSPVTEIWTKELSSWQRSADTVYACAVTVLAAASCYRTAEVLLLEMEPSSPRASRRFCPGCWARRATAQAFGLVAFNRHSAPMLMSSFRSRLSFKPSNNAVETTEVKACHKTMPRSILGLVLRPEFRQAL